MTTLFSSDEYRLASSSDLLPLKCEECGVTFLAQKKLICYEEKHLRGRLKYCSIKCSNKAHAKSTFSTNCSCCGKPIKVTHAVYTKSKTHQFYCSQSCAAKVNNSKRNRTDEYRKKVSEKLKEYHKNNVVKKIETDTTDKKDKVKNNILSVDRYKERVCHVCGKRYFKCESVYPGCTRSFCSAECQKEYNQNRKYYYNRAIDNIDGARDRLRKGGQRSMEVQSEIRRSKNEKLFCSLCEKQFLDVEHNKRLFNGWDADVIIHDYKIAVLWNGKWHYETISRRQSLAQIQNRDKIKISEIEKVGYRPYVIRDDGKYNPQFVETEFKNLLNFIALQKQNKDIKPSEH